MEYIIISVIIVLLIIITKIIFEVNYRKIKEIVEDETSKQLDEITKKYPKNEIICKWFLKKLNNENVQIEVNESKNTCLYIAITNKILIADVKKSYTRIQTIAHECIHSVQGRKILMFNFIFSNIYLLYFFIISILAVLKLLPFKMLFLAILILLSMVYLLIRNYLENDAMIKARYLAKEYMEDIKISDSEEIEKVIKQYDYINPYGIKATNFQLFFNSCIKIVIFSIICILI